jgi:hypothetical protein
MTSRGRNWNLHMHVTKLEFARHEDHAGTAEVLGYYWKGPGPGQLPTSMPSSA